MKIFNITSFFLLASSFYIFAQQSPVFTHYSVNPYLYNPAQVGEDGYTRVGLHYRNQWVRMPDAPETALMTVQGMVNNKFGLGGRIFFDKAHIVENYGAVFSYAYYARFKKNPEKHYLSIGLSAGFKHQRLNFQEGTIRDDFDPSIFYNGASKTLWDAEGGITYRNKGFRISAFAANLAPNQYRYRDINKELDFSPAYHVYGAIGYDIVMGAKKNVTLKPLALARYIPNIPFQFDGSLILDLNTKFWIGGGYRYKNTGLFGIVGARVHDMVSFTYSYEQSIDAYQVNLGTTHEMSLEFRIKPKDKDLIKEAEEKFDRIQKKLLENNRAFLDSINIFNDKIEQLEKEINNNKERIEILEKESKETIYKEREIKFTPVGTINFFVNSAHLHKNQIDQAEDMYENLNSFDKDKVIMIRIVGSASIEASEEYNLILSNKRTESVRRFLLEKGVDGDLISTYSKGSSEAVVRDTIFEELDNVAPNPDDRYVRVYVLYSK